VILFGTLSPPTTFIPEMAMKASLFAAAVPLIASQDCDICAGDKAEYCEMFPDNKDVCDHPCGFVFDESTKRCWQAGTVPVLGASDTPIIGGSGNFKYQYMPDLLKMPGASLVNVHGLVTDAAKNIYATYQNDGKDQNCLIKWNPDGTGGEFMQGNGSTSALCDGTPHGLKIAMEDGVEYLYHANNNQKLTKTKLDGTVIWQVQGFFGQNPAGLKSYRPTWHAILPGSKYTYLCDGYGSNQVYEFNIDGNFLNNTWGGRSATTGPDAELGKFSTNHGCTHDPRVTDSTTVVVSDRENHRFQMCEVDPVNGGKFDCKSSVDLTPSLGEGTRPCNLRMYPEQEGRAITPDLAGPVAVFDQSNAVISVVNVSVLLAAEQFKHPHDAMFLPNGDMVVATWAPGRIAYWKLLKPGDFGYEGDESVVQV